MSPAKLKPARNTVPPACTSLLVMSEASAETPNSSPIPNRNTAPRANRRALSREGRWFCEVFTLSFLDRDADQLISRWEIDSRLRIARRELLQNIQAAEHFSKDRILSVVL